MGKARTSKKVIAGISAEVFEDNLSTYAAADAKEAQVTSKMDVEITRIREKYADALAETRLLKEASFEVIQTYCEEQKAELFSKRKSLETVHGIVGFRTGTPKLKTLKGFTWSSVTNLLKEFLPSYIRTTEEPAKDRLLADRDQPEVQEKLSKVGLLVDQDESFYVELKKEEALASLN